MLRAARTPCLLAVALVAGCAKEHAHAPVEDTGLPLIFAAESSAKVAVDDRPGAQRNDVPPPEPPPPLSGETCAAVQFALSSTSHGVLSRVAFVKALDGAAPALREAVCACPPRATEAWLLVTTTPDRGTLSARSYAPDAAIDACLAQRLRGASLPR